MAEAYLHDKFHLDPTNRLATVHQRCRQTGQDRQDRTGQRSDSIGEPFYKRSTKMRLNVNTIKLWYLCYLITEQ